MDATAIASPTLPPGDLERSSASAADASNNLIHRDRAIHLARLPPAATRALLFELFSKTCGPLTALILGSAASGPFALIEFAHASSAAYACAVLDGVPLCGAPLCIRPSADASSGAAQAWDVRVRPAPPQLDAAALAALFAPLDDGAAPPSARLAPRGCAFVSLSSHAAALRAIDAWHGVSLCGATLEVQLARRHEGAPAPRGGAWGEWQGEALPVLLQRRAGAPPGAPAQLLLTPQVLQQALRGALQAAARGAEAGAAAEALAQSAGAAAGRGEAEGGPAGEPGDAMQF